MWIEGTHYWMKHAFPWVSRVEVWGTFCFLSFQLNRDLGCGWLVPSCLRPSTQMLELTIQLRPHSSCDDALRQFLLTCLTGSCSSQELKEFWKRPKKGGMLRRVIKFLWLVLVVSSLDLGEALTCYSCGPHSDQVIPLTFPKSGLLLGDI